MPILLTNANWQRNVQYYSFLKEIYSIIRHVSCFRDSRITAFWILWF